MKKILSIIVFIATYSVVYAQVSHTIDTIWNREPTYFYQYWFDSLDCRPTSDIGCGKDIGFGINTEVAKYNYTNSAMTIIGVAAVMRTEKSSLFDPDPPPDGPIYPTVIIEGWTEQMKLYKPTDTGMVLLASQNYSILDTAHWMKLFYTGSYTHSVVEHYKAVFEVYFDEPVIVTDSFYVATTNHFGGDTLRRTMTCVCRHEPKDPHASCWPQRFKIGSASGGTITWQNRSDSYVWFILPIIDTVQPICEVPLGLHVSGQDSTGVHLAWDSVEHNRSWTVAYGRANADVESFVEYPCTTTDFVISDLEPGVEYAARVRAVCFDDDTYSDWSDTIRFEREGEVGIGALDNLPERVSISPNPAHTEVVVVSDAAIKHIEVYDMQGHRMLRRKAYGKQAKIMVENWPKGGYVIYVFTTQGTSIQKMVIE